MTTFPTGQINECPPIQFCMHLLYQLFNGAVHIMRELSYWLIWYWDPFTFLDSHFWMKPINPVPDSCLDVMLVHALLMP